MEQQIRLGEIQPGRPQFRVTPSEQLSNEEMEQVPDPSEFEPATELSSPAPVQVPEVAQESPSPVLLVSELDTEADDIENFLGTTEED